MDIINYVIVKILLMHHSVMELIEIWLKHIINHIEDSIKYGDKLLSMQDLFICIGIGILESMEKYDGNDNVKQIYLFKCLLYKYTKILFQINTKNHKI